jgi:glyoxylase-like metal-dependent hydrolase (beta-lactamase superfamily II)
MDVVYGDCTPIDADRIMGIGQRDRLDLGGGRVLDLLATPGHAKHHISALDNDTGALFVGDSVGVKTPDTGPLRPATPPPDFDLELAQATLQRYRDLDPQRIYLAHYGAIDPPQDSLIDASERLAAWAEVARDAVAEHDELDHVADTLARRFAASITLPPGDDDAQQRVKILGGFRQNAMGLLRYWRKRFEAESPAD